MGESKTFGAQGGKARAAKMSKTELSDQAKRAAAARWGGDLPIAEYPGVLKVGDIEIGCAVLGDGLRVLTQAELLVALGRHRKANVRKIEGEENTPPVLQGDRLKPFISNELLAKSQPIRFRTLQGSVASGYRAEILRDICDVYINAAKAGKLTKRQGHIAVQADILVRGLATVGIIALVDEATGYQVVRPKHQLAEILDAFIAKELRPWVRKFPFDFYEQIYRLKGWDATDLTPNSPKPLEVGKITVDLIYKRLAPGVRPELKRLTPRNDKGYLANKLFQRLTGEIGDPKLEKLIAVVTTVMKLSPDWQTLLANLEMLGIKKYEDNLSLALDDAKRIEMPSVIGLPAIASTSTA